MQQPKMARVESGKTASLRTLRRVADALNADVRVSIVPPRREPQGWPGRSRWVDADVKEALIKALED